MEGNSPFAVFGDSAATMLSALIFLGTGTLAFAVMLGIRAREAVRRRAAVAQRAQARERADAGLRAAGVQTDWC